MNPVLPASIALNLALTLPVSSAELDANFAPSVSGGIVHALQITSGGTILAVGDFLEVNGSPARSIASLAADGSLNANFTQPALDGAVYTIVQDGSGAIYIGGGFNSVNAEPRSSLARLSSTGIPDGTFVPSAAPNGRVNALALLPNGAPVFGGYFRRAGTSPATYLWSYTASGANGTFIPALEPSLAIEAGVTAVAVQADGKVLAGGTFNTANGPATLVRLNPDGSLDESFSGDHGPILYLEAIAVLEDGGILIGGAANPDGQGFVRRLNSDGSIDSSFQPAECSGAVKCLASDGTGVLAGGSFASVNGQPRSNVARFSGTGVLDPNWNFAVNGLVKAVAVQDDGAVILGGAFTRVNDVARGGLARLTGDSAPAFRSLSTSSAGEFATTLEAEAGRTYVIEASADLEHWNQFSTNTATNSGLEIIDRNSAASAHRFFRARLVQ